MSPKLKMLLSTAAFGTISLFVRRIELPSAEVALFRAAIALACLLAFKGIKKQPLAVKGLGGELPLLFLSGAAMGFNWIFLFEAYRYTAVSVATLSYYFAPMLVVLLSPPLFHERLTGRQVLCFLGSTAGLILVINPSGLADGGDPLRGVLFGLIAACLYATVILLNKRITRVGGIDRVMLQFFAVALVLLPYVLLTGGFHLPQMDGTGWLCLLAVGALHSGVAYVLYFSALSALPGQEAAILSYIDPLVAVLISLTVLAEPVVPAQLLGGAMILAFTVANEIKA